MLDRLETTGQKTALSCPRCQVELSRVELVKHLWLAHRLLVDGAVVREPWQLIGEWIDQYCREGVPELLQQCRVLAERVDPERGVMRLQRLLLAKRVEDAEARGALLAEARTRHASLCPACYALIPVPEEAPAPPLNVSHGRLSGGGVALGYRIEVSESGLFSRLEIETPRGVLFQGRERDRGLTKKGALLLFVGPPVMLALALAVLPAFKHLASLLPVSGALLLALTLFIGVGILWAKRAPPLDRAVDYAWTFLVPRLHAAGFDVQDSAFIAGLALTSAAGYPRGPGRGETRAGVLRHVLNVTEAAVARGAAPVAHLASLWRLAAADAAAAGRDPLILLTAQVGRCFEGKAPMVFAEHLLAPALPALSPPGRGESVGPLVAAERARWRVLLCDRAFEAGLEVGDLLDAGRAAPSLGDLLAIDDPDHLARLRFLWSLRPGRPWERCGEAATVFEIAMDPARRHELPHCPDLLLATPEQPPLHLCGRGVIFRDVLFTQPPRTVEIKAQRRLRGRFYCLVLDGHQFSYDSSPDSLVAWLERWFRYYFLEFLPGAAEVRAWRAPHAPRLLVARDTVECPECHRAFGLRAGEVGTFSRDP